MVAIFSHFVVFDFCQIPASYPLWRHEEIVCCWLLWWEFYWRDASLELSWRKDRL